jgi:voltage-gated potassium channel
MAKKTTQQSSFGKAEAVEEESSTQTRAQQIYENWAMIPIFAASITWVVAIMFEFDPRLAPEYRRQGIILNVGVLTVFITDLIIRFILDPTKKTFLRRNWILFLALIIPVLRFVLILSAIRRIRQGVNSITAQVGLYAMFGVATVVFVGSVFTLAAEINRPDSNIDSFGDAVWWAFVTITTVGYGDFTPVTETGRTIAVVIMFSGAAAVGTLTAALASRFSAAKINARHAAQAAGTQGAGTQGAGSQGAGSQGAGPEDAVLQDADGELKERIERVERRLEEIAAHLGVPISAEATRPPRG